jgi:hypothetical protein
VLSDIHQSKRLRRNVMSQSLLGMKLSSVLDDDGLPRGLALVESLRESWLGRCAPENCTSTWFGRPPTHAQTFGLLERIRPVRKGLPPEMMNRRGSVPTPEELEQMPAMAFPYRPGPSPMAISITRTALPITSALRFWPWRPLGIPGLPRLDQSIGHPD